MLTLRHLIDSATYWAPGALDGFGGTAFATPQSVVVRWEDKGELVSDAQAREFRSRARVFTSIDIAVGGYLARGTHADANPADVEGAYEVKRFDKTSNLRGTETVCVSWV